MADDAGIQKRVSPHLLRHTMATKLVNSGMPLAYVRKVLGQKSSDTTRVHAEATTESVQERFEAGNEEVG